MAPVTNYKLSEAGAVPPILKSKTGLMLGLGIGWSGIFDKDLAYFIERAHTMHSKLSRKQVEYMLILIR